MTAPTLVGSRIERDPTMVLAGAVGAGLTALAVIVTAESSSSMHPELVAGTRGVIVAAPIAVGLYAQAWPQYRRFGRMLALLGAGWALTALAESNDSVLYSTGRVAGWVVEVGFAAVILAFPYGRLRARWDRALVAAYAALLLFGYLPTALFDDGYPTPSPWAECRDDCPANAFQVVDRTPHVVGSVLPPAREALTLLVFAAVAVLIATRMHAAGRLTRLTLVPVLAVMIVRLALFAAGFIARRAAPDSTLVEVLAWLIAVAVPAMAIAFLVGLLRWQLYSAAALQRFAVELREHPDVVRLRTALAATLGDPWLDLVFWKRGRGGEWVDSEGHRVDLTTLAPGRSMTAIGDGDARVAGIVHDASLDEHPEFVLAAGNYAAMALDNHQLVAQVRASLREVQASRARILATADEERRRIERDLHDGAQQRLVALRIKLELAEEILPQDPRRGRQLLHEIGDETVEALEDVRSLAHGVYPALLTQRGLGEALRDAALRSPIPVRLEAAGLGRYPADVESAVYFCCLEALQNAIKHALSARMIAILLSDDGRLRFEVTDDGAGFDPAATPLGTGMANMRDRLAAVGGELTCDAAPGQGTSIVGVVRARG